MPSSKARVRKDTGEVLQPLNKADRIRDLLKLQLLTFPQKELFPEEIGNWERDLDPFPLPAIEWAFDNWRRNGRFFPVYGDIIDQCIAWLPEEKKYSGCSRECKEKHGKGYHWNDVLKLWKLHDAKRAELGRALNDGEIDALLSELDSKREGGAPEWRL